MVLVAETNHAIRTRTKPKSHEMPGNTTCVFRSSRNSDPRLSPSSLVALVARSSQEMALLFLDFGAETIGRPCPGSGATVTLWCFLLGLLASGRGGSPWREINNPCSAAQAWPLRLPRAIHTTTSTAAVELFCRVRDHGRPRRVASEQGRQGSFATSYAILAAARGWGHIRAGASPSGLRCGEAVRNTRRWTMPQHPSGRGAYRSKVYIVASCILSLPSSLVFISISSLYFLSLRYRDSIVSGSRPFASLLLTFVSPSIVLSAWFARLSFRLLHPLLPFLESAPQRESLEYEEYRLFRGPGCRRCGNSEYPIHTHHSSTTYTSSGLPQRTSFPHSGQHRQQVQRCAEARLLLRGSHPGPIRQLR
jgi:hypothetical protein